MQLSTSKIVEFIKANKNEILIFMCVFLIAILSFGLGLLMALKINQESIKIESCSPNVSQNLDQLIN